MSCLGPSIRHGITQLGKNSQNTDYSQGQSRGLCPTTDINPNFWILYQQDKSPKYLALKINRDSKKEKKINRDSI